MIYQTIIITASDLGYMENSIEGIKKQCSIYFSLTEISKKINYIVEDNHLFAIEFSPNISWVEMVIRKNIKKVVDFYFHLVNNTFTCFKK